jgi:hypothetical protein
VQARICRLVYAGSYMQACICRLVYALVCLSVRPSLSVRSIRYHTYSSAYIPISAPGSRWQYIAFAMRKELKKMWSKWGILLIFWSWDTGPRTGVARLHYAFMELIAIRNLHSFSTHVNSFLRVSGISFSKQPQFLVVRSHFEVRLFCYTVQ